MTSEQVEKPTVVDLMQALEDSIAAAKAARDGHRLSAALHPGHPDRDPYGLHGSA